MTSADVTRRPVQWGWGLAAAAGLLALALNAASFRAAWSTNIAYLRLDALLNHTVQAVTLQPSATTQDWHTTSPPTSGAARFVAAYGLGLSELTQGRYESAIAAFQAALAAYPEYAGTHALIGDADHAAGEDDMAVPEWRAAQAQPLLIGRGNQAGLAGNWKAAAGWYLLATRVDPNSTEAFWRLGQAYTALGERQAAIDALQTAVSLSPNDITMLHALGLAYLQDGALELAATQFERVLALKPDEFYTNLYLSGVELSLGQLAAAETHAVKATQFGPTDPRSHFALGSVYARRAQWPAAIRELRAAVDLIEPWNRTAASPLSQANKASYHLLLAQTYESAGQPGPAMAEYQAVLSLDPKNAAASAALKALHAPGQP